MQAVFVEIARRHAVRQVSGGILPDAIVGRWWKDEEIEIDVVGLDDRNRAVLVGEAKWQERLFSASQLGQLRSPAGRMGGVAPEPRFIAWSRRGVDARAASRHCPVLSVGLEVGGSLDRSRECIGVRLEFRPGSR